MSKEEGYRHDAMIHEMAHAHEEVMYRLGTRRWFMLCLFVSGTFLGALVLLGPVLLEPQWQEAMRFSLWTATGLVSTSVLFSWLVTVMHFEDRERCKPFFRASVALTVSIPPLVFFSCLFGSPST